MPEEDAARRATPQDVCAPLTRSAIFLVLEVSPGGEAAARDLLAGLAGLVRSVGFRSPAARLSCVAGIGASAWPRLFAGPQPAELHPFEEVVGRRHRAVSTPGDLLFHVRGEEMDVCFELASLVVAGLEGSAAVVDEVHGFRYFDERDLLGFVDGTENPTGAAALEAALVGAEDAAFAGGSYVLVQKYLHDLSAWNAIPVEEQERAVGRTKLSNVELGEGAKPADSHVALNTLADVDGRPAQIVRANMPFGRLGSGELGTYFIGYCRTPRVLEEMIANMFRGRPEGSSDRILDYSRPVTGTLFFAPSVDLLEDLPPPPARG